MVRQKSCQSCPICLPNTLVIPLPAQKCKCPDHHPCSPKPLPTTRNLTLICISLACPAPYPSPCHARHDLILWAGCICRTRVSGRIGGPAWSMSEFEVLARTGRLIYLSIHPFPSSVMDRTDPSRSLLGGHVSLFHTPLPPPTRMLSMCVRVVYFVHVGRYIGLAASCLGASCPTL